MSATGRSDVRVANDFYETPPECTRAILSHLPKGRVLDPCCGDRAILRVVEEVWGTPVRGYDVDPARMPDVERDALNPVLPWGWPPDASAPELVITNPPYKLALPFVERALKEIARGGTVAMLLRLPFLESVGRQSFHRLHPADVYVFAKRPSFTKDGKTDATAYAWFVWGADRGGRWEILPHMPAESESAESQEKA